MTEAKPRRGGRRENAGRPSILTSWQRLDVGLACEERFVEAAKAKQSEAIEAKLAVDSDYRQVIARVQAIPVAERRTWLESDEFQAHCADVEEERHAVAGTDPDTAGAAARVFTVPLVRPQGVRDGIIADIAKGWTEKLGRNVSRSTVRRCWEEYRAMLLRLEAETDQMPKV